MNFYTIGQLSPQEKNDILSKHREIYDGYKTMLPKVSNTQPLYVQDFANDKNGLVVTNKGNVKAYTNVKINETYEATEVCDECGAMEMDEGMSTCNECGGLMMEGECSECGWKGGEMEENIYKVKDLGGSEFDYTLEEEDTNYDEIKLPYNFESEGPLDVYPVAEEDYFEEYEPMESAWADELEETDITGVQGMYSDMEPPFDFDSEGLKKGKRSSYYEEEDVEDFDVEEGELEENIPMFLGGMAGSLLYKELNNESINRERQTILEMMNRMNSIK